MCRGEVATYVFPFSVMRDNAYHTMTRERLPVSDLISLLVAPCDTATLSSKVFMAIRPLIKCGSPTLKKTTNHRLIASSHTLVFAQSHGHCHEASK